MKQNSTKALMCLCSLALVGISLFSPGQAFAGKRIALFFDQSGQERTADVAWVKRLTNWAFRSKGGFSIYDREQQEKILLFKGAVPARVQKDIAKMKAFLLKGKKLYVDKEGLFGARRFPFALKSLNVAQRLAEKHRKWLSSPVYLRDAYIFKALVYLSTKKPKLVRSFMTKAILYAPTYELPSNYPKGAVNYYKVLRKYYMKQAQYKLSLKTYPKGAKLYLNNKYMGETPFLLEDLPPGQHIIRLEKTGYTTLQKTMTIKAGQAKTTNLPKIVLKLDPRTLTVTNIDLFDNGSRFKILKRLRAIRGKLGVEKLYIFRIEKTKTGKTMYLAVYKKNSNKVRHRVVKIGGTKQSHRRVIVRLAKQEAKR